MVDPDEVRFVGWAENDYWAQRAWQTPFAGPLSVRPPRETPIPSLAFAGRPEPLTFGSITAFEAKQPGWSSSSIGGNYRITDGLFVCVEVRGRDGVRYSFASRDPRPADPPAAFSLQLPGFVRA
jgi:hypothetical protein